MKRSNNDNILYENPLHWDAVNISDFVRAKLDEIKNSIPKDVTSIIDVGCGNGVLSNELSNTWQVIGIDRSRTALRGVVTPKVLGDIAHLPFRDESCDMTLCSEVLEHLPVDLLDKAVTEILRISRKYILITVPCKEYLPKNYIKCPTCGNVFNASYHVNTFDIDTLVKLFSDVFILRQFKCGKQVREYNPCLLKIKQHVGKSWARFSSDRHFICPNCRQTFLYKRTVNIISIFCDGLNRLVTRKHSYWLGVIFSKK